MPTGCAAWRCTNRRSRSKWHQDREGRVTFHKFPLLNPGLLSRWVDALKIDHSVPDHNSVVCSDHFSEGCFNRDGRTVRLRKGAVPDVFQLPARLRQTAAGGGERSDAGGGEGSDAGAGEGTTLAPLQSVCKPSPPMSRLKVSKWCITPGCKNTSWSAPGKLFIAVPKDRAVRRLWWSLIGLAPPVSSGTCLCCEDHFEMDEDVEDYTFYMAIRNSGDVISVKKGVVPSIFACQDKILKDSAKRAASLQNKSTIPSEREDGPKRTKLDQVFPEEADIDSNPSEAESEDVSQIKSEPEDGNFDDPMSVAHSSNGLEQATDGGGAEDASTEFDGERGVKRVKLELLDSDDAEANSENVTPSLNMLSEVKPEVVEAATTSSSPDNGADVLPGNDCDSESDSQPGLERDDNPGIITGTRRYKCGLCYYSTKSAFNLQLHSNSHKSYLALRKNRCDVCSMTFPLHDHLVAHRLTHPKETMEGERTYWCSQCRLKFSSLKLFKDHNEGTHTAERLHACKLCPKRFTYPGTLDRHILHDHKQKFRCNRCGKGFVVSGWHKRHQASCFAIALETASDESPEQQARIDKVQFKELSSEPVSADVFSTESSTGTQTCLDSTQPGEEYDTQSVGADEASFQQHGQLIAHRRTHPKEAKGSKRTNYCIMCREQFTSREAFEHHMEAHTLDKPYGCHECPKRFGYVANLSRHFINKHTQDFRCDRCGKGFVTSSWHQKHQASCVRVRKTVSDKSLKQQAPRMDYGRVKKVSSESASADVFSTESTTGTQKCLDSTQSREDHATDSVGAGEAHCFDLDDSVPVDSRRNGPKVDEIPPPEKELSIDSASEEKSTVDPASEVKLSSDLEDEYPDESPWEKFSVYSALDEQPSADPLALD